MSKLSKYVKLNKDILLEYIYDDGNLISEPYSVLVDSRDRRQSFISVISSITGNTLGNQLFKIDQVFQKYAKVNPSYYSFLQLKEYSSGLPVRHDTIKIHIPINWTFGEYLGFYIRVYAFDRSNQRVFDISNFYFDMTDVSQQYLLNFTSPPLLFQEKLWGKNITIQVPALSDLSNQRNGTLPKENSINANLTNGAGFNITSPIFIDYHFIDSVDTVGGNSFFNLSPRQTVVVPQTPEFEKLGVKIEESTQGDFFLIYGVYNGTLGDFENFIDESYYEGNRYYVEYQVDLYEKNVKTKTHKFIVTEDFGEEIEYRPILKFTTTTAIIDVTLRLINNVDGSFIERKASYGLLQGGGAKMGSEPNTRLNTSNGTGGGGDISKYTKSLTKINLKNAKRKEVINVKSTTLPNVGDSPFGTKPILNLKKLPFNLFSQHYFAVDSDFAQEFDGKRYIQNNGQVIYIYPFDNIISFEIINSNEFIKQPYDLSIIQNLKLTIKSDKKDLNFDIYRDSSENDFINGKVVFKISEGSYNDIKKVSASGFDLFYINGVDESGLKIIVYSSFFLPWDSVINQSKLLSDYDASQIVLPQTPPVVQAPIKADQIETVKESINQGTNIPTSVNTTTISRPDRLVEIRTIEAPSTVILKKEPRWKAAIESIEAGFFYKNWGVIKNNKDSLKILLLSSGFLQVQSVQKIVNTNTLIKSAPSINDQKLDLLFGYFKGLNIEPTTTVVRSLFNKKSFKNDLDAYVNNGLNNSRSSKGRAYPENEVSTGEFLPSLVDFQKMKAIRNTSGSGRNNQMFQQQRPVMNSSSSGNVEQDKKNSEQMKNARRNSGSSGNVEQDKKNSEQMRNRRK